MVHSGLPESRHEPTKSLPASSMSIFTSRACMSPAWFSMATFSPASTMRERTLCSTCTVFSMWASRGIAPVRSAEVPSTQRTMREPTIARGGGHARELLFGRPFDLSKIVEVGQIESMPISTSMPSFSACARTCLEILLLQAAQEADFAEMDHPDAPLRGEIEILEGRPALRAQAEQIEAEFDLAAGSRRARAPGWREPRRRQPACVRRVIRPHLG